MACLIDTGILLRAFDAASTDYRLIRQALRVLWARQERLMVTLQNLAEFWNVSTRAIRQDRLRLIRRVGRQATGVDRAIL